MNRICTCNNTQSYVRRIMIVTITFIVMLKMMMDGLAIILIIVLQRLGLSFEKRIFDGLYLHLCSHAIISSILTFRISSRLELWFGKCRTRETVFAIRLIDLNFDWLAYIYLFRKYESKQFQCHNNNQSKTLKC